jgi:hypothetical protein
MLLQLSVALVMIAVTAIVALASKHTTLARWDLFCRRIQLHPWWCAAAVMLVSIGMNAAIAMIHGIPLPRIHDEFCYLLESDTFAHGRLTNPTPPMWEHFEAPNVLMHPTYQPKYPPASGLVMALGQVTTGLPIAGIWLAAAIMVGAVFWMMMGFMPASWALLIGLLTAIQPQFLHWSQTYWGGTVAMLGGVLVLGAWGRLMLRFTVGNSLLLGIGLAILGNSRPYEGLATALFAMIALLWRIMRDPPSRSSAAALILPAALVLAPVGVWMGYDNFRVTGHVTQMAYGTFSSQYGHYPKLWPMATLHAPAAYLHPIMQQTYMVFEKGDYDRVRSIRGLLTVTAERIGKLLLIAADPYVLVLPFAVGVVVVLRQRLADPRLMWIVLMIASLFVALWLEAFFITHYAAPGVAAELVVMGIGWRAITGWRWRGWEIGRGLAIGLMVGCMVAGIADVIQPIQLWTRDAVRDITVQQSPQLHQGRHLVFLAPNQDGPPPTLTDWGYNTADIAGQRIIWAREMGPSDAALAHLFPDRQIWLLTLKPHAQVQIDPYLRSP